MCIRDRVTLYPLLLSREFVADADGLCAAIRSSPNGSFYLFVPNSSPSPLNLQRGHRLGTAHNLSDFHFLTNSSFASAVQATTPPPRPHSSTERINIRQQLIQAISSSEIPSSQRDKYLRLLISFQDVFSSHSLDVGLTDICLLYTSPSPRDS